LRRSRASANSSASGALSRRSIKRASSDCIIASVQFLATKYSGSFSPRRQHRARQPLAIRAVPHQRVGCSHPKLTLTQSPHACFVTPVDQHVIDEWAIIVGDGGVAIRLTRFAEQLTQRAFYCLPTDQWLHRDPRHIERQQGIAHAANGKDWIDRQKRVGRT
jgi:hypothetical protein